MERLLEGLTLNSLPELSLPGPYFLDEEIGSCKSFYTDPSRVCLSRCSGFIVEARVDAVTFRKTLVSGGSLSPLAMATSPAWFYVRPTGELLCVNSDLTVNLFDHSATSAKPRSLGAGRRDNRRPGFRIDSILAVGFSPRSCVVLGNTGDIFQFANVRKGGRWQRVPFGIGGADDVNLFIANIKSHFPGDDFKAIPWSVHVVNTDGAPVVYAVWPGGVVRAAEQHSQKFSYDVVSFAVSASSKFVAALVRKGGNHVAFVHHAVTFERKDEIPIQTQFETEGCQLAWIGDAAPIVAHQGGLIILDKDEISRDLDNGPLVFTDVDCCIYITPGTCHRIRVLPPTFIEFLIGYTKNDASWELVQCFVNRRDDPPITRYGAVRWPPEERAAVVQRLVDASYYFALDDRLTLLNSAVFVWSLGTKLGYRNPPWSFSNAHARHRILETLANAGMQITSEQLDSLGLPSLVFCLTLQGQPGIAISIAQSIPKTHPFAANAITLVRTHAIDSALAVPENEVTLHMLEDFDRLIGIEYVDVARRVTSQGEKGKTLAMGLIASIRSWSGKALVYERIGKAEECLNAAVKSCDHSECLAQRVNALISGSGGSPDAVNDLLRRHEAAARFIYRDLRSRDANDPYAGRLRTILLGISEKGHEHVKDLPQRLRDKQPGLLEQVTEALAAQDIIPTTRWATVNEAIRWLLENGKDKALTVFTKDVKGISEAKIVVERIRFWVRKGDMRRAHGDESAATMRKEWLDALSSFDKPYHKLIIELVLLHAPGEILQVLEALRKTNSGLEVRQALLDWEARREQPMNVYPNAPSDKPIVPGWLA